jgi:hypothetical protein
MASPSWRSAAPAAITRPLARETLRAAIAVRDEAATLVRRATEAAERARQLMFCAKLRVAQRARVDADHHSLRVEALKAYATDPAGGPPPADVPPEQPEQQREREEARAARAAYEQLETDVRLRVKEHREADARVEAAAKRVLVAEGELIAAEIDERLQRVLPLHDQLAALAQVSAPAPGETWAQGQLQLTRATIDRITTPLGWRPELPGGAGYVGQHVSGWQGTWRRCARTPTRRGGREEQTIMDWAYQAPAGFSPACGSCSDRRR